MADLLTGSNNDPFAVIGQDTSDQRAQLAQYSILRAAGYLQDNKNDEALKAFKQALAFDPQNSTAQSYIGKINLATGNNFEAIKAFKEMVRSQPGSVDAHMNLGNAYLQDKQYAASENEFMAAAKLDPSNPLPSYTLGLQYSNTNRLAEAESQFLKVQKISPKDGNVYYALGMTYNRQGRNEEAVASLEKALALKKDFLAANYELGVAYDALGNAEAAQGQLSILQKSNAAQTQDLQSILNKPAMISMSTKNSGGFIDILGPGTPLWMLDPTLLTAPNSSKTFSVTISFSTSMDPASVTNTQNWSIARSNSTEGGYYNNGMPLSAKDVVLPSNPESVRYNSLTGEATLNFRLNQNINGDAVIDPSHITFKFSGKDSAGRDMDVTANEINAYTAAPY